MDGILRYAQSAEFAPGDALDPEALARLTAPQDATHPSNLIADPGFEEPEGAWLEYGKPYAVDDAVFRSGKRSLKLAITPEDLKREPAYLAGAQAKPVRFRTTPRAVKLSAWHKTQNLGDTGEREFLIFVYITYKTGGQYTLRLPLKSGTHDWEYAEVLWKPERDITGATLRIGLTRHAGTAWIDDVYLGEAPADDAADAARAEIDWRREPLILEFGAEGVFRIGGGSWKRGAQARVAAEGITAVQFKESAEADMVKTYEVGIDTTPPVILVNAKPVLEQEGGVYYASPDTRIALEKRATRFQVWHRWTYPWTAANTCATANRSNSARVSM